MTDQEVVRLLLSGQEQTRVELGKLSRATATQGAKLDAMEGRFGEIQQAMVRISEHTSDCQARGGWATLREDVSEIRIMVSEHDRKLSENAGYQAAKTAFKDTPKNGHKTLISMAPLTLAVSVKDPKTWAKIVFYTLVATAAALSFVNQYF